MDGAAGLRQRGREPARVRNPISDVPGPRTAMTTATTRANRAASSTTSDSSGTMIISARRRRCEVDHTVRDRAGLRGSGRAPFAKRCPRESFRRGGVVPDSVICARVMGDPLETAVCAWRAAAWVPDTRSGAYRHTIQPSASGKRGAVYRVA